MYQIKFKQLLLTALCAVSVSAYANVSSSWVGESQPGEKNGDSESFYLYNATAGKYIGNPNSATPELVSDESSATEFNVIYSLVGTSSDWYFQYTFNETTYYLYRESPFYKTSNDTKWGVGSLETDPNLYYLGVKRNSILIWQSNYWYFMQVDGTIQMVNSNSASNNNQYQWNLISASQFEYRPKLESMISDVTDYAAKIRETEPENYAALQTALTAASNALSTSAVQVAYSSLQSSYNKVLAGESYATATTNLQAVIAKGESVARTLKASMGGKESSRLNTALQNALSALNSANTIIKEDTTTAAGIAGQTKNVNDAILSLKSTLTTFSNPNVSYAGEMKSFAEDLGCPLTDTYVDALLEAVESGNDDDIHTAIENAQSYFKATVNSNVNTGYGFPKGTDMTGFILNNSFETGTTYGWTLKDGTVTNPKKHTETTVDSNSGVSTDKITYDLEDNSATYTQTLTGLPKGTYTLSAGSGSVSPTSFTIDDTNVNTGVEITISGQTIDDIKLTLVEGAASIYTFTETSGVLSSARTGVFSTVNVTRNLKSSDNWNTFCSPCSIEKDQASNLFSQIAKMTGVKKVANQDGTTTITLQYESSDHIDAGVAYLVKAKSASETTSYSSSDATVVSEIGTTSYSTDAEDIKVMMVGTLVPYAAGEIPYITSANMSDFGLSSGSARTYILQSNVFRYLDGSASPKMNAFRAYFILWEPNNATFSASAVRMSFEEAGEETCIANINVNSSSDQIFDLNGRQVTSMTNGLYVKSGKKVFIQK